MQTTTITAFYFAILGLASLLAFFVYGTDKHKAGSESAPSRIRESTLLALAAYGGALGALVGRLAFHHKTHKIYFSIVIYLALAVQLAVGVLLVLLTGGVL